MKKFNFPQFPSRIELYKYTKPLLLVVVTFFLSYLNIKLIRNNKKKVVMFLEIEEK